MNNGGLLDCVLGNTDAEIEARDKYAKKLEKEISEYRRAEARKSLLGNFPFDICSPLGS